MRLLNWFTRKPTANRSVQFEAVDCDDDNDIELAAPKADEKKTPGPPLFSSSFFYIYYRAFLLLGDEVRLGVALGVANIFLSIALLAEPVLFGKVINALTQLGDGSGSSLWTTLLPLLISWSSFSLFGACASIFIGLFADQLAHRRRHVVYAMVYEHALTKTPIASKHMDAGKIKKMMDEGRDACFWNWLNILRTELVSFLALLFLLPLSFYLNPYMAISIVVLCVVFGATTAYVSSRASGMQHAITQHYIAEGSLTSDVLSNLALVQSFGIASDEVKRLEGIGGQLLAAQYPVLLYWAMVVSINQCATSIAVLCVVMEGAWLFSHGLISVGELQSRVLLLAAASTTSHLHQPR
jgi:ATP-binding cassette subfamily B protein